MVNENAVEWLRVIMTLGTGLFTYLNLAWFASNSDLTF